MPTPTKPTSVIKMEKKSHRTKRELAQREAAESALSTGLPLKVKSEVKNNAAAFKEFKRVSTLLKIIDKNDALVENVINRYCQITAEILDFEVKREEFSHGIEQLQAAHDDDVAAHPIDTLREEAMDAKSSPAAEAFTGIHYTFIRTNDYYGIYDDDDDFIYKVPRHTK